jgi:hypothetical protein
MLSGKPVAQPSIPVLCSTIDSLGFYNITIEYSKNTFTGLLILKKNNDSTLRLILNAEIGPKLLDMDLTPLGYKTNYVFKKLNKKRILKTFYEDFGALAGILIKDKACVVDSGQLATSFVYDQGKQKKIVYFSDKTTDKITAGRAEERKSAKTIFYYFYNLVTSEISSMRLEHQQFRMVITLNKINL